MKLALTGATGFIGSHILTELVRVDGRLIVVDGSNFQ